jgi:hypothetical protein
MASTQETIELEGTWEEILEHADELAGRRVRVTVLAPEAEVESGKPPLKPENQRMLEVLEEWYRTPLTEEEKEVLDGFEQFRREHPIRFRQPSDFE